MITMKVYFLLLTLCLASVVSRISPSLKTVHACTESSADSPESLRFAPTAVKIGVQELVCFNQNCPSKRLYRPVNRSSFLSLCLILLSGDIELNPGPGPHHPCGSCARAVRSCQRGIFCEVCYYWFHSNCVDLSTAEYERLGSSDEGWCCPKCSREALPFFDSSTLTLEESMASNSPSYPDTSDSSICSAHPPRLLKILYTNCRSLPPNLDSLRAYAASHTPDIIALCETWIDDTISDFEIFIPEYFVIRRDRNRHGGGVLLYIKENIPIMNVTRHATIELLFVEVSLKHCSLSIGLFYRPPSSDHSLTELELFLESLPPTKLKNAVLLGDFNINLLSSSPSAQNITSTLSTFHLSQIVTEPTRISSSSSLIDHVYISDPSLANSCQILTALGSSDHSCISLLLTRDTIPPHKHCR